MNKTLIFSLALLSFILPSFQNLHANEEHHHHHSSPQKGMMEMDNANSVRQQEHHHHKAVSIENGQPVPEVDLIVHQDSMKGWNLEIKLDNFAFTPESVNQQNQPNEGHAHLYVNGEKVTRIYGNWYYLPELASGTHELRVALNTNGHEFIMYQGKAIEDLEVITVP